MGLRPVTSQNGHYLSANKKNIYFGHFMSVFYLHLHAEKGYNTV